MIFSKNIELQIIHDSSSIICMCPGTDTMEFLLPEVKQDKCYIRLNQPGMGPSCARWCLDVLLVGHLGKVDTLDVSVIDVFL